MTEEYTERYIFKDKKDQVYDKLKEEYLNINKCRRYMNDYEGTLDILSFTVQREVYTHKQLLKIMENLSKAEWIVEHWLETINDDEYEELYAIISDSRNRIEGITHYSKSEVGR